MIDKSQLSPATYVQVSCLRGTLVGRLAAYIDPAPLPLPQPFLLGRGQDCHLSFKGSANRMVSRHHAELQLSAQGIRFRDGSSQGSYLAQTQERVSVLELARGEKAEVQLGPGGPLCEIASGIAIPFGSYSLVAKLGEGGMAEVYLAGDNRLERFVVLKLLHPAICQQDPLAGKHLLNEARIVAQLEHQHVVRIYELGELSGIPYIAMEYLRGISLRQLNEQLAALGRPLPPALAAALVRQACLGLHAAHELPAQVVHRDISHNNILITREGVKVIDFGIARTNNPSGVLATAPNVTKGCPPYMSPEQIRAPQTVTRLSDIFSMAVVLYELCSGQRLFARDHPLATLAAVLSETPPPLRSVCEQASEQLERLLARALCKQPSERQPATAETFAALLKEEAGPDFLHHENVIGALEQLGVRLQSSPPLTLDREPELLRRARPHPTRALSVQVRASDGSQAIGGLPTPIMRGPLDPLLPSGADLDGAMVAQAETQVRVTMDHSLDLASADPLLPVALPPEGGSFELHTAGLSRLFVTSQDLSPREYREPIPLALELDGLVSCCRHPLVLALANRLIELRVAPETVKAGRAFRIYPFELSTSGARNSFALPLPCPGKPLHVGHHRGKHRVLTVASSSLEKPETPPLELELGELGVKLLAPASTDRLFAIYRIEPEHSHGYLSCFTVRQP